MFEFTKLLCDDFLIALSDQPKNSFWIPELPNFIVLEATWALPLGNFSILKVNERSCCIQNVTKIKIFTFTVIYWKSI